jgi:outer membrane protein
MKKIIILAFVFASAFRWGYAGETAVNLGQALNKVYSNNPAIKEAEEAVNAAKARVGEKKSGYLPVIGIEGSYVHLDPDPQINFPGFGLVQMFPADNYDAHAFLRQTLLDFGRTSSAVGAAKYSYDAAKKNLEIVKINLTFQTIQTFYSVLLLKQSVAVQQEQINSLKEALTLAIKKVSSGSATLFDELTTKVKLAEAQSQKIDIENMLRKNEITLARLMGSVSSDNIEITGEFYNKTINLDEKSLISAAEQNRAEYKLAKDNENTAKSQLSASKAENYPSVLADFSYGSKNGYFPILADVKQNTVASAQLTFPLFNGLRTYHQVLESEANYAAARERTREAEDLIVAEVRQAVSEARASMDKIRASELNVQLAQEALSQAKVRYESGVITNLDLLNAETSLAQANLLHLQALYNYTLSKIALNKAVGAELLQHDN